MSPDLHIKTIEVFRHLSSRSVCQRQKLQNLIKVVNDIHKVTTLTNFGSLHIKYEFTGRNQILMSNFNVVGNELLIEPRV